MNDSVKVSKANVFTATISLRDISGNIVSGVGKVVDLFADYL